MPITINGDGTITGISTGGLPDGSIATADIAEDAVTLAKLSTTGTPGAGNFLRGDNSWQAAGGAWNVVNSVNITSAVTSVTITGIDTTYDVYCLQWSNFKPANDNTALSMQVGTSSAISTGSSDYEGSSWGNRSTSHNSILGYAHTVEAIVIDPYPYSGIGNNATGPGSSGQCYIYHPRSSDAYAHFQFQSMHLSNTPDSYGITGWYFRTAIEAIDRLHFTLNGNTNMNKGRFTLYGIAHA